MVLGLEAACIQAAPLQKMAGEQLFLLLPKYVGGALVGGVDVPAYLAIRQLPTLVSGVLTDLIELSALQQELHDLGGALVLDGFVGVGHVYLTLRLRGVPLFGR